EPAVEWARPHGSETRLRMRAVAYLDACPANDVAAGVADPHARREVRGLRRHRGLRETNLLDHEPGGKHDARDWNGGQSVCEPACAGDAGRPYRPRIGGTALLMDRDSAFRRGIAARSGRG